MGGAARLGGTSPRRSLPNPRSRNIIRRACRVSSTRSDVSRSGYRASGARSKTELWLGLTEFLETHKHCGAAPSRRRWRSRWRSTPRGRGAPTFGARTLRPHFGLLTRRACVRPSEQGAPNLRFGGMFGKDIGYLGFGRHKTDLHPFTMEGLDQPVNGDAMRYRNMP